MAEIIMYDLVKFKKFLEDNVFSEEVRKRIIKIGTTFDNTEYSIMKLGPGTMRSSNPAISLTREVDGTHKLTKSGETPITVNGPKVPPKLE